jgi:hypothetical protein
MKKEAAIILGNALIWGCVVIACSLALKGTGQFQEIQHILGGGAGASLLVVSLTAIKRKPRD